MPFYKYFQKPFWISLILVLLAQGCAAGGPTPGANLSPSSDLAVSKLVRISNPGIPKATRLHFLPATGPFRPICTRSCAPRTATCSFSLQHFAGPGHDLRRRKS